MWSGIGCFVSRSCVPTNPPSSRRPSFTKRASPITKRCSRSSSGTLIGRTPASPIAWAHRAVRALDGRSPSIAKDDFESLSRRNAAARATRSFRVRPMISRARTSRPLAIAAWSSGVRRTVGQNAFVPGRLSITLWRVAGVPFVNATCNSGSTRGTKRKRPPGLGTSRMLPVSHSYRYQSRRANTPAGVARTMAAIWSAATARKSEARTQRFIPSHLRAKKS